MSLELLDLRDNQLLKTKKLVGKLLKDTVVLAWDNQISAKNIHTAI